MFDQSLLDRVRAANDIMEVVGEFVSLKKAGANSFKGLCPFHKEKTPSFHVNTALQIFKCFGCGAGGNVTTFLGRIENLSFPEAVKRLAERARIPLPEASTPASQERKRLLQICETAATLYQRCLLSQPEAARAREYLARRKLSGETISRFRLGYSNGRLLSGIKVNPALLARAGLAVRHGDGNVYDRLRGRITIPIMDESGQVIGFGGRALEDSLQPKYINTPETPLFKKSACIFALSFSRDSIRKAGRAILVEGYFDAISAHQSEVSNVVAVLGTSLTDGQLRLLKRFTQKLVIVYDEDVGGNEAALRGLDLASESGFEVKIARMPDGLDPDQFISSRGKDAFLKALEDAAGGEAPSSPLQERGVAMSLFDFRFEVAARHADTGTLSGRLQVVGALTPFLARLPNAIERHAYVKRLAELLQIRESDILEEVERHRSGQPSRSRERPPSPSQKPAGRNPATWRAEQMILTGVLQHRPAAISALLEIPLEAFRSSDARALAGHLKRLFTEGAPFSIASLMDEFQSIPGILELLGSTDAGATAEEADAEPASGRPAPGSAAGAAYAEASDQLKLWHARQQLRTVQQELERTKDPETIVRLLEAKQRLALTNS